MTPRQYKTARTLHGTQATVAAMLGVDRVTVAKRETGALPISREAELAIRSLPLPKPQPSKGTSPPHPVRLTY